MIFTTAMPSLSLATYYIFLFLISLLYIYIGLAHKTNKTEVESVQIGYTYIADMDKCCPDKYRGDSCYLLYMFQGPFV